MGDFEMHWGYSPKGERFITEAPLRRGKRIHCLASMTVRGLFCLDFYYDGGVTYDVFEEHMCTNCAVKMVREGYNDIVMDNARIHHAHDDKIVAIFKGLGIRVHWLAPYWPQGIPRA